MANNVVVSEQKPLSLHALVENRRSNSPLSKIEDAQMQMLLKPHSRQEILDALTYDPVAGQDKPGTADLIGIRDTYFPSDESVTFIEVVLAHIRRMLEAKDFGDQQLGRYVFAMQELIRNDKTSSVPHAPNYLSSIGVRLSAPSGCGKTALLQRLDTLLPAPFELPFPGEEGGHMRVIPKLSLTWPDSVERLVSDIREKLSAFMNRQPGKDLTLKQLKHKRQAEYAVYSLCLSLNVCLITVDNCRFDSLNKNTKENLAYFEKLKEFTGIPIIFSGTPVFFHAIGKDSRGKNVVNGPVFHLTPMPPPRTVEQDEEKVSAEDTPFHKRCEMWWARGGFPKNMAMPKKMPIWLYPLTLGREGWLAHGMEGFLTNAATKKKLSENDIEESEVIRLVGNQLNDLAVVRLLVNRVLFTGTLAATETTGSGHIDLDQLDLFNYADHFNFPLFAKEEYRHLIGITGMPR